MKFTRAAVFISVAYLASAVSAQIISITSPLSNTIYKAGQEAIISWVNPKVSTISQIVLTKGPPSALQPVLTIATNVNANDLKYVWEVPFELENGNEYAFEFGTSPDLAFTGTFTIEGAVGGNLPASNVTASSVVTTSSPSPVVVVPGGNAVATPAASVTTTTTPSLTVLHDASASSTSAANKQVASQAAVALLFVVVAASQFF